MSQDKEWRPFEPCLENVQRAQRSGRVFLSFGWTQQEERIIADASRWLQDVKNPTLIPIEDE